jgi:prophage regulatory protein
VIHPTQPPANRRNVIRRRKLCQRIGVASTTIYDWLNESSPRYDATFPRPVPLGQHAIGWLEDEVDQWLAQQIAKRDQRKARGDR